MVDTQTWIKLETRLPENLAAAVGYTGPGPWVGFWWERAGDEIMVTDGRLTMTGNPWPWLFWMDHGLRAALQRQHLESWALGSSDDPATWMLVANLETGDLWLAPYQVAQVRFYNYHWPNVPGQDPEPPLEVESLEDLEGLLEDYLGGPADFVMVGPPAQTHGPLVACPSRCQGGWVENYSMDGPHMRGLPVKDWSLGFVKCLTCGGQGLVTFCQHVAPGPSGGLTTCKKPASITSGLCLTHQHQPAGPVGAPKGPESGTTP